MRTPAQALLWELWRLARFGFLVRIVGMSLFGVVLFWLAGPGGFGQASIAPLVMQWLVGASLISGLWVNSFDNQKRGFPFTLGFTRPVSTLQLVAIPMAFLASSAALCYLIPVFVLEWLFGISFSWFPVALCVATVSCCLAAALWCAQSVLMQWVNCTVVGGLVVTGLVVWVKGHTDTSVALFLVTQKWWTIIRFSAGDYLRLLLVLIAVVAIAVTMVNRQRHGDAGSRFLVRRIQDALSAKIPSWNLRFQTPGGAQFWLEMRRSSFRLLWWSGIIAVVAPLVITTIDLYGNKLAGTAVPLWLSLLVAWPVLCSVLGAEWMLGLKRKQGVVSLSSYDLTQAMRNDTLVVVKLAALTTGVFLSWVIVASSAVLSTILRGDYSDCPQILQALDLGRIDWPFLWCGVLILLVVVMYISGILSALVCGLCMPLYPRRFLYVGTVMAIHVLFLLWDSVSGWRFQFLWTAYGWILLAGVVAVTLVALLRARRWGFLGKRYLITTLIIWGAYVAAALSLALKYGPASIAISHLSLALGGCVLIFPLTTAALAPLSIAAHRHR